jgi:hypothetical protein
VFSPALPPKHLDDPAASSTIGGEVATTTRLLPADHWQQQPSLNSLHGPAALFFSSDAGNQTQGTGTMPRVSQTARRGVSTTKQNTHISSLLEAAAKTYPDFTVYLYRDDETRLGFSVDGDELAAMLHLKSLWHRISADVGGEYVDALQDGGALTWLSERTHWVQHIEFDEQPDENVFLAMLGAIDAGLAPGTADDGTTNATDGDAPKVIRHGVSYFDAAMILTDQDRRLSRDIADRWQKRRDKSDGFVGDCLGNGSAIPAEEAAANDSSEWDATELTSGPAGGVGPDDTTGGMEERTPVKPKNYLFGWAAIASAVGQHNDSSFQKRVKAWHRRYGSPIVFGEGSPRAVHEDLVCWWNDLQKRWSEVEQRRQDASGSVADTYQYGREETVVTEIRGHVKKRRQRRLQT